MPECGRGQDTLYPVRKRHGTNIGGDGDRPANEINYGGMAMI